MSRRLKLTLIGITLISGITIVVGYNSWFGAGGSIPEDTFTRGLVAYWSFDEGTGNIAYDISGNGNNCTIYGAKWTKGKYGSALQFDGVDDYVEVPHSVSLNITDAITIEAWINTSSDGGWWDSIVSKMDWGGGTRPGYTLLHRRKEVEFIAKSEGGVYYTISPLYGTWIHVAGRYDGECLRLYVNGVERGTPKQLTDGLGSTITPLKIGRLAYEDVGYFHGIIDEVRIYNRALSPEEIRYHYNRGRPVAHWRFDEGSGTTTYDSSGNEYHGILHE